MFTNKIFNQRRPISFKNLTSKQGLTLLEIMMVIALLGLIFTFIGKNVWSKFTGGKRKITGIFLAEIKGALDQYKLDCNDYPKNIQALIENPGDCPAYAVEGYMSGKKQIPKDPYGCPVFYSYEAGEMTLKSLGQGCQEGGEGEATDIPFTE
ncbi:MAG: type II secretion system protein GspG [Bdellovibrionota bacterium]